MEQPCKSGVCENNNEWKMPTYRNAPPNMTSPRLWLKLNPNHARHRLIFGWRAIVDCCIAVRSPASRGVKLRGLPRSWSVNTPCIAPSNTKILEPTMRSNWITKTSLRLTSVKPKNFCNHANAHKSFVDFFAQLTKPGSATTFFSTSFGFSRQLSPRPFASASALNFKAHFENRGARAS